MSEIIINDAGSKYEGTVDTTTIKVGEYVLDVKVTGIRGEKGEKGDQGIPGPAGKAGINGKDGSIGPQGPKGETGAQGPAGKDGINGKDGKDGKDGVDGKDGLDGLNGEDGDSAYEIAVADGFKGSVEEWLKSLKGADGKDGQDATPVEANPKETSNSLNSLKIGNISYKIGSGTAPEDMPKEEGIYVIQAKKDEVGNMKLSYVKIKDLDKESF